MDPWWRRRAADEKTEPVRPEPVRPEAEDESRVETAGEDEPQAGAGADEAAAPEPGEDPSTATATAPAAADEAEEADDAPAEEAAEPSVSAALEAATEPAEPARPATGEAGEAEPAKRRRRRRRRSRRGRRGGGSQQQDDAGKGAEARSPEAAPRGRKSSGPGRAAVLLDLGGLERSLDGGPALDLEGLLARLDGELGKLVLRRVYADASDRKLDRGALHGGGAEVVDVPSGTEVRGCSAAVRIVVDALELCYTKRGVDTVVLVATSVQMLPLVAKLQQNGVTVVGLGGSEGDAQVRAQCDRFIDLSA